MGSEPLNEVVRRRSAERDLSEIWQYIADDAPSAADRQLVASGRSWTSLAAVTTSERRARAWVLDYAVFAVGRYVLWYREIAGGIELIRVLHGARHIGRSTFD